MRISDWSSDVCSSDLLALDHRSIHRVAPPPARLRAGLVDSLLSGSLSGGPDGLRPAMGPRLAWRIANRRCGEKAHVRRCRERGWQGLGQPLKSFRDSTVAFPAYGAAAAPSDALDAFGPLRLPGAG